MSDATNTHKLMMWLGHNANWLIIAMLSTSPARTVIDATIRPQPWLQGVITAISTVLLILAVLGLVLRHYHDSNLCDRHTGDEVLDPQGEIERRRNALRHYHRFAPRTVYALLGFSLLSWAVRQALFGDTPPLWAQTPDLAVIGVFIYVQWTQIVHNRLEEWCPICRRGGGGGFNPDPIDPTDPRMERRLKPKVVS